MLAHLGVARCLQLVGEFGEARKHVEKALAIAPEHPRLHLFMCSEPRPEEEAVSLEIFQKALEMEEVPNDVKTEMEFASAKILDRQKKFDEAFTHYKAANDLRYAKYPFRREANARFTKQLCRHTRLNSLKSERAGEAKARNLSSS